MSTLYVNKIAPQTKGYNLDNLLENHIVISGSAFISGSCRATGSFLVGSTTMSDDSIVMTPSTGDTATIAASTNGALTVTTVDAAGADADLTFTLDGAFDVNANQEVAIDSTVASITVGAALADGQTLKLGKNGAVETIIAPHSSVGSELYSVTNTAGTAVNAISLNATAGGITLNSDTATGQDAVTIDASQTTKSGLKVAATAMTTGDAISVDVNSLTTGNALYIDHDSALNGNGTAEVGIHYDFQHGDNQVGDGHSATFTGMKLNMDDDADTHHTNSTVTMRGLDIDLTSTSATGDIKNYGLDVTVSGGDSNFAIKGTSPDGMIMHYDASNYYVQNAQSNGTAFLSGSSGTTSVYNSLLHRAFVIPAEASGINGATISADYSGAVILQSTNSSVITLPAVVPGIRGCKFTFVCAVAGIAFDISPNASDKIMGTVLDVNAVATVINHGTNGGGTDNKDLKLDSGSKVGDRVTIVAEPLAGGWIIIEGLGSWVFES